MFGLLELKRMYAGFKQNNKRITKEDFRTIFSTFCKTVDVTMASEVFEVFQLTSVSTLAKRMHSFIQVCSFFLWRGFAVAKAH
jgi:hypothetical protein